MITFRFHVIEKMCKLRYKQYLILYGGEIIEFEGEAARRKSCDGGPAVCVVFLLFRKWA